MCHIPNVSSDLAIKQTLVRSLKSTAGLDGGSGMTGDMRNLWPHHITSEYNSAMQNFTDRNLLQVRDIKTHLRFALKHISDLEKTQISVWPAHLLLLKWCVQWIAFCTCLPSLWLNFKDIWHWKKSAFMCYYIHPSKQISSYNISELSKNLMVNLFGAKSNDTLSSLCHTIFTKKVAIAKSFVNP